MITHLISIEIHTNVDAWELTFEKIFALFFNIFYGHDTVNNDLRIRQRSFSLNILQLLQIHSKKIILSDRIRMIESRERERERDCKKIFPVFSTAYKKTNALRNRCKQ